MVAWDLERWKDHSLRGQRSPTGRESMLGPRQTSRVRSASFGCVSTILMDMDDGIAGSR